MKQFFSLLIFMVAGMLVRAQDFKYEINDFLDVKNITKKSLDFYNKQSFTVKLKQFDRVSHSEIMSWTIPPGNTSTLSTRKEYFSRQDVDNVGYGVYYDSDCLLKDIERINQEKIRRQNNAEFWNNVRILLNGVATYYSNAEPTSSFGRNAQDFSRKYLDVMGIFDRIKGWKEEGLVQSEINRQRQAIESEIAGRLIDKGFSNSDNRALAKALFEFANSDFEVQADVSDLDARINYLIEISSNNVIRTYYLPYDKYFKQHIDYDGDGIPNDMDKCPQTAGKQKFKGCTRKQYYRSVRLVYELSLEGGIFPGTIYKFTDKDGFKCNFRTKYDYEHVKFIRITNFFQTNRDNMFYLPVQYARGEKLIGQTIDNFNGPSTTYSSVMDFHSIDANLGWLFKLFGNKGFKSNFLLELGVNHTIYQFTKKLSATSDTSGNVIEFSYENETNNLFAGNLGLGLTIDFDYFAIQGRYNLLFYLRDKKAKGKKDEMACETWQMGIKIPLYRKYR